MDDRRVQWWPPERARRGPKVLHDGGEVELVLHTREAPRTQALEAVMGLQVRKVRLDLLALPS